MRITSWQQLNEPTMQRKWLGTTEVQTSQNCVREKKFWIEVDVATRSPAPAGRGGRVDVLQLQRHGSAADE